MIKCYEILTFRNEYVQFLLISGIKHKYFSHSSLIKFKKNYLKMIFKFALDAIFQKNFHAAFTGSLLKVSV